MRAEIKLYNEDCLPAMRAMRDNEFDLAIVDPPYGFGQSVNFRYDKCYDNTSAPSIDYFNELYRVSANQIIWGANYFTFAIEPRLSWLSWYKKQPAPNFSDFELAWTSFKHLAIQINLDSYGFNHADKRMGYGSTIHPTQKPVVLYKWLIDKFAKPGEKILDTHLGSGSIAIACWDMGFDLTAYEIDKEYYDAACNRFEQHSRQMQLF